MGFFAFSGVPQVPVEATPTEVTGATVATTTIAAADPVALARVSGDASGPLSVILTSYNAVAAQTDANPMVTASGARSNPEVVAARSIDLAGSLPFGTVVALEYDGKDSEGCRYNAVSGLIGYRVIADSMASRKRGQVDVLFDAADTVTVHGKATNPAVALGLCHGVTVRPIGRIKVSDMPSTQEELRKLVEGDSLAINK